MSVFFSAVLAAAVLSTGVVQAQTGSLKEANDADPIDWSRFRGPNGTGISHAETIPSEWTADDYNWVTDLPGQGHGSPVIVGNRLYVLCGDRETAERMVVCLNTDDGTILWQKNFDSKKHRIHTDNTFGSSTPVADQDGVIVTWADPEKLLLMALDRNGDIQWQRDLGPYDAINGAGTSPIIVGDLVVLVNIQMDSNVMVRFGVLPKEFADENPNDSLVIAVDRRTGKTRWTTPRETYLASYATPCVRELEDGRRELIVLDSAFGLTGVDLKDGAVNWQTRKLLPTRTVASPVIAGDLVFGSHGAGTSGQAFFAVRAGSLSREPSIAWEIRKSVPLTPTPIVKGDLAFLWSDNGVVTCIAADTGDVVWRNRVGGSYYGSPIWVNGRLYCTDRTGNVAVIAAAEEYRLFSRVPLGEPSFATPAVANGVMYFRTETKVLSLGGK
ncbi:MAG TPA: hypothetical protein DCG12_06455 [Planctomycetaceae bacterium]|nr:hypothetical protein [Planctomycetaceae bacterium]